MLTRAFLAVFLTTGLVNIAGAREVAMRHSIQRYRGLGTLALALVLAGASPAAFALDMYTSTYLFDIDEQRTDTALTQESIRQADSSNLAIARVNASTGAVGIGVQTSFDETISAQADLTETWGCGSGCALNTFPLPTFVPFSLGLEGTLSPADMKSGDFGGRLAIRDATFNFLWNETAMAGELCHPILLVGTVCDPVTIAMTTQSDGSLLFNETLQSYFSFGFSFDTTLSLYGGGDSTGGPIAIDFLNTFHFDILSDNPDLVWTSDSGRISIAVSPPTNTVPEPATLTLLSITLAGLGFSRRRKLR
jgi:hypothetical protein